MNKLDELALKYGTDKIGKHHYTPVYYDLFSDKRSRVKKVLEIGAGEGASLRMWRDFFYKAKIYSAEIEDGRIFKSGRIEVIKCDQSKKEDLENLIARIGVDIDLVVDDGSHVPSHQAFTCQTLMPFLQEDVVYVIEDVADAFFLQNFDLSQYQCKETTLSKRYDDRLIVVKHKREVER